MPTFERHLVVPAPRQLLHDWHLRNGAFERLSAPWETIRLVHADPVANGAKRIFEVKKGGLWIRWIADHRNVVAGEQFTDVQERGPFKRWQHTHRFELVNAETSRLVDHVEYDVPLGVIGRALGGSIRNDVERLFIYRHRTTLGDLAQHGQYLQAGPRRIAISGASGLIGRQMVAFFRAGGHEIFRLVRNKQHRAPDEIRWSVEGGIRDLDRLEGLDAVIHLAGANIAQKWTAATRRLIMDSRVLGTRTIVAALARLSVKPKAFISASAAGYYGNTEALVDEDAPPGQGFLPDVCQAWEQEILKAENFCRTCRMRVGVVMDPRGGALAKLLPVFKAGIGGRVGNGRQLVSWVGLDDVLGAFLAATCDDEIHGAINVTGPEPVPQAMLAKTLGQVLSRPALAPAPAAAIEMLFGKMGRETVLNSTGARPARLLARRYEFRAPTLEQALRHCLGRGATSVSEPT